MPMMRGCNPQHPTVGGQAQALRPGPPSRRNDARKVVVRRVHEGRHGHDARRRLWFRARCARHHGGTTSPATSRRPRARPDGCARHASGGQHVVPPAPRMAMQAHPSIPVRRPYWGQHGQAWVVVLVSRASDLPSLPTTSPGDGIGQGHVTRQAHGEISGRPCVPFGPWRHQDGPRAHATHPMPSWQSTRRPGRFQHGAASPPGISPAGLPPAGGASCEWKHRCDVRRRRDHRTAMGGWRALGRAARFPWVDNRCQQRPFKRLLMPATAIFCWPIVGPVPCDGWPGPIHPQCLQWFGRWKAAHGATVCLFVSWRLSAAGRGTLGAWNPWGCEGMRGLLQGDAGDPTLCPPCPGE